ncbi:hypothetical protein EJV47_11405 [Hymenobacter gummosus]|uniref:Uncharacterized protein n=1 Tax=Hymenobacter gummosus TaxID=1776032 RepID=A0A3S0JEQ8_9BACT|nr:hypothetical protein [Hymenobacter gummosus]RTQ50227.1 hypothetical protein EJV47_11405 [Hymenobacter gummosus]
MGAFLSTGSPVALRQRLLRSLAWTALGLGLDLMVWLVCDPTSIGRGAVGSGARLFLLLLANVGMTALLTRQVVVFEPIDHPGAKISTWPSRLAAYSWLLVLLLLTCAWVLADVVLLLGWLFEAGDYGDPGSGG